MSIRLRVWLLHATARARLLGLRQKGGVQIHKSRVYLFFFLSLVSHFLLYLHRVSFHELSRRALNLLPAQFKMEVVKLVAFDPFPHAGSLLGLIPNFYPLLLYLIVKIGSQTKDFVLSSLFRVRLAFECFRLLTLRTSNVFRPPPSPQLIGNCSLLWPSMPHLPSLLSATNHSSLCDRVASQAADKKESFSLSCEPSTHRRHFFSPHEKEPLPSQGSLCSTIRSKIRM